MTRATRELKREVAAGTIGAPVLVHCVHRNPAVAPTFTSEMIITDTVVHEIDCVRWLLDQELVRATVYAGRSSAESAPGLRDPQFVVLETEAGVVVDVEAFVTARYGYDIRCELVGESGTLALAPTATVVARRAGEEVGSVPAGYQERFATAYVRELQEFVAGIAAGDGRIGRERVGRLRRHGGLRGGGGVAAPRRGGRHPARRAPGALRGRAHAGALSHPSTLRLTRAGCS